jgi:glycosyltransferase involved in cell wall biosynthesis
MRSWIERRAPSLRATSHFAKPNRFLYAPGDMPAPEDQQQAEITFLRESGLFLDAFVLARNAALAASGLDPLEYFCRQGFRRGEWPNPYFDPSFYLAANQDVAQAGINPLTHYAAHGDREGRDPCPFFDVKWYRNRYGIALAQNTLAHYLARRFSGEVAPVPFFDPVYYFEQNPDVATNGGDPFEHFLAFGAPEMRNPCEAFDIKFYVARYGAVLEGQNPLLHFLRHREGGKFLPARPEHEKLIPGAVRSATRSSPHFEEVAPVPGAAPRRATLLAFYLPQFHRIPENDAWWGKGFTDWTNLLRAVPRFAGHLQPRVPRDLGFYDLAEPEVLRRQISLARGASVHGFVFYHYWFNGKRLLERPLENLLADAALDFPFCVMWANENFTRRWDGLEREILLAQEYLPQDDDALIEGFVRLFDDPRYILVAGRPLLMIYRANLIPDAARRIAAWRKLFAARGKHPLIVMAQSLGDHDPTPYGLDGAVEFPPHKISDELKKLNENLDLFDPEFSAAVYDYEDVAAASLATPAPQFPLIKSLTPGWDNEPRREGKGLVLHGATPQKYQAWLESLIAKAEQNPFHGEKIICVNAWNEWAEGAFLEPDLHFGGAFLNATGRAICGAASAGKPILILVGHDAQPHGAQLLLLDLARRYAQFWGFDVKILLLGAGRLVPDYEKIADVTLTNDKAAIANFIARMAEAGAGAGEAIVNTSAAARLVPQLKAAGMRVTLLVHEMPKLLAEYNLQIQAKLGAQAADDVVFASAAGRDAFCAALGLTLPRAKILPQGNYQMIGFNPPARAAGRARFNIAADEFLVLGIGFADLRKGFDLFLQIAAKTIAARENIHFLWAGEIQPALKTYLSTEIAAAQATGRFHLTGFSKHVETLVSAADVFALTSREDPYPTVALEALAAGAQVIAFEGSGGIPALLRETGCGAIAAAFDPDDFRAEMLRLLDHCELARERQHRAALAGQKFDQRRYAETLILTARPTQKTIAACVLSYNHAPFIRERLESVFAQTYPIAEILLLDDASTDETAERAALAARAAKRAITLHPNAANGGSVLAQWRRAAHTADAEFIWLAEGDDKAAPGFLAALVAVMAADPAIVMAFSDSRAIDAAGQMLSTGYGAEISPPLSAGTHDGAAFAATWLGAANQIFSASAILWRRAALLAALERLGPELPTWRLAGDWRIYLETLTQPGAKIAVIEAPLNRHRRHAASVTATTQPEVHIAEIARMQAIAAKRLKLSAAARAAQASYLDRIKSRLTAAPEPGLVASIAPV